MANEPTITVIGNLGADPELRFLQDGTAVATISVGNTERKNINGQWQDVGTTWYRVTAWKDQAEAITETLRKGDKVVVVGKFKVSKYEKDGVEKTSPEINAEAIGVIPKRATQNNTAANTSQPTHSTNPW